MGSNIQSGQQYGSFKAMEARLKAGSVRQEQVNAGSDGRVYTNYYDANNNLLGRTYIFPKSTVGQNEQGWVSFGGKDYYTSDLQGKGAISRIETESLSAVNSNEDGIVQEKEEKEKKETKPNPNLNLNLNLNNLYDGSQHSSFSIDC